MQSLSNRCRAIIAAIVVFALLLGGAWALWISLSGPGRSTRVVTIAPEQINVPGSVSREGWKTTSPGGTSIELVGVTNYPSDGRWWKPDGTRQPTTMPTGDKRASYALREGEAGYKFLVRASWRDQQIIVSPRAGAPARVAQWSGVPNNPGLLAMMLTAPSDEVSLDLGVGVQTPAQSIHTLADVSGDMIKNPQEHKISGDRGTLKFGALEADGESDTIVEIQYLPGPGGSAYKNGANWIYVYGGENKIAHGIPRTRDEQPDGSFTRVYKFNMPLERVRRIVIGIRPTEYAEFQNISLRPGIKTKVTVIPVAPADRDRAPATRPIAVETTSRQR